MSKNSYKMKWQKNRSLMLTEGGDLKHLETRPNNYILMPAKRELNTEDFITPPPSPPSFPPPPKPDSIPPPPPDNPPLLPSQRIPSPPLRNDSNKPVEPLLRQVGDPRVNARSLSKNPITDDIMTTAAKFKVRREQTSSPDGEYEHTANTNDNRMKNRNSGDQQSNEMKTRTKRNSFVINPKAKIPGMKSTKKQTGEMIIVKEKKKELSNKKIPDIAEILAEIPYVDSNGNTIAQWRRELMARNKRLKYYN